MPESLYLFSNEFLQQFADLMFLFLLFTVHQYIIMHFNLTYFCRVLCVSIYVHSGYPQIEYRVSLQLIYSSWLTNDAIKKYIWPNWPRVEIWERQILGCINHILQKYSNIMHLALCSQILSPWLGGKSTLALGCRSGPLGLYACRLHGGPVRQPYARVDYIPQSGTKNWASVAGKEDIKTYIYRLLV
jgi:hypothetical protein